MEDPTINAPDESREPHGSIRAVSVDQPFEAAPLVDHRPSETRGAGSLPPRTAPRRLKIVVAAALAGCVAILALAAVKTPRRDPVLAPAAMPIQAAAVAPPPAVTSPPAALPPPAVAPIEPTPPPETKAAAPTGAAIATSRPTAETTAAKSTPAETKRSKGHKFKGDSKKKKHDHKPRGDKRPKPAE